MFFFRENAIFFSLSSNQVLKHQQRFVSTRSRYKIFIKKNPGFSLLWIESGHPRWSRSSIQTPVDFCLQPYEAQLPGSVFSNCAIRYFFAFRFWKPFCRSDWPMKIKFSNSSISRAFLGYFLLPKVLNSDFRDQNDHFPTNQWIKQKDYQIILGSWKSKFRNQYSESIQEVLKSRWHSSYVLVYMGPLLT